jgi:tol-pal system protein YbgF
MAQPPATVQTRQEGETTIISSGDSAGSTTAVNKLAPGSKLLGTVSPQSVDSIHEGRVPAQQPAAPTPSATARNAAQAPPPSAAPGPGDVVTGSTQVGTANPGHVLPDAPVQEQYNYAFKLLQQRDYTGAEAALREFVNLHPKEPLAGNAMYWMGETFYVRKNYPEAARIFLDAYQRFPKGNKAPDNLFKLGRSLAEIGENSSACTTYSELLKSFPHANERILSNARGDMARLKCS